MEITQFDDLTRSISGSSRRQTLRALGGAVLAGMAARFGLAEDAAAKRKKHASKPNQQRRKQAERQAHGQLRTEGKGKGKGKGKQGKKRPKDPPQCGAGEKACPGGGCISVLECCPGQRICPDASCVGTGECCEGEKECPGGSCISVFECCPGESMCPDSTCVAASECCPGERHCFGDDVCVAADECCPAERKCPDGECVGWDSCCPGRKRCPDGSCIPDENCCPDAAGLLCAENEQEVCCNGEYVCRFHRDDPDVCPAWMEYNPATCRCQCPAGSVEPGYLGYCCPPDLPCGAGHFTCSHCGSSEGFVCANGFSRCTGPGAPCCRTS